MISTDFASYLYEKFGIVSTFEDGHVEFQKENDRNSGNC